MAGCTAGCKDEFKASNFLLTHPEPWLFVTSQWPRCRCPLIYVVYRVIIAIYFSVWIILSGVVTYDWVTSEDAKVKWFIYLTNWCFFMLVLDVIVEAIIACYGYLKIRRCVSREIAFPEMTWYLKTEWVLYNVATTSGLLVTLAFWAFIYSPIYAVHPVDYNTHAANSVYILLNTFITAIPARVYHAFHSLIFCVLYIIFTVVYQQAGGTNGQDNPYIYSILDWGSDPGTAAIYAVIMGVVACVVIWLLVYGLYAIRRAIYRCTVQEGESRKPALGGGTAGDHEMALGHNNVVYVSG